MSVSKVGRELYKPLVSIRLLESRLLNEQKYAG
jgi:hypothetical protein